VSEPKRFGLVVIVLILLVMLMMEILSLLIAVVMSNEWMCNDEYDNK
jgi:hypothetical protein